MTVTAPATAGLGDGRASPGRRPRTRASTSPPPRPTAAGRRRSSPSAPAPTAPGPRRSPPDRHDRRHGDRDDRRGDRLRAGDRRVVVRLRDRRAAGHRPDRRRRRAGHLRLPDGVGVPPGRVRPHRVAGRRQRRHRRPADDAGRPHADLRVRIGAQLLDVYVHTPTVAPTSTSAAFPSRNYSIAPADAWSQRIEVQGFAPPVWVDATGASKGNATVVASQPARDDHHQPAQGLPRRDARTGLVVRGRPRRPGRVLLGPGTGLHDTPGDYSFGVCQPGGTSPICALDPNTVPKAMDVLDPAGSTRRASSTRPPRRWRSPGVPVG